MNTIEKGNAAESSEAPDEVQASDRMLKYGCYALAVGIALEVARVVLESTAKWRVGDVLLTDIVAYSQLVPEVLVMLALLTIARLMKSIGLWRSSILFYGSLWLLGSFALSTNDDPNQPLSGIQVAITAGICLGVLAVLALVAFKPSMFRKPQVSEVVGESKSGSQGKRDDSGQKLAGLLVILLYGTFRLGTRWLANLGIDWLEIALLGEVLTLMLSTIIGAIWMGISKLRLRCELGVAATVSGCLDILLAVAMVGVIVLEELSLESGDGSWLFSIFDIAD